MDTFAQLLFYLVFVLPVVTITYAWRSYTDIGKIQRVLIGLVFGLILSFISFYLSIMILFRDGMGPG